MAKGIKQGDIVVVITGEYKGRRGEVLRVDRKRDRVVVEGVNERVSTVRRGQGNMEGGFETRERPIHISNVMPAERYDARRS